LIFISIFIFVLLSACLYNYATINYADFYYNSEKVSRSNHNAYAEVIFTVVPAIIVFSIAAPSFALLYTNNDWLEKDTELTVSVTGHQWYWAYEYSLDKLYFESEAAWKEFFVTYYGLNNYKVGEVEALPHLFNNLVLLDEEKDALFGRILNCHTLMTVIDATEEYDSYMIDEDDINNNNDFSYSSFSRGILGERRWDAEAFNYVVPVLALPDGLPTSNS